MDSNIAGLIKFHYLCILQTIQNESKKGTNTANQGAAGK
jgi:hypothetical protein